MTDELKACIDNLRSMSTGGFNVPMPCTLRVAADKLESQKARLVEAEEIFKLLDGTGPIARGDWIRGRIKRWREQGAEAAESTAATVKGEG